MKGAAENAAMGTPRSSFLQRSASVPPTRVIGAEKAMPSMARQTSKVSMFWATAHGMMNINATKMVEALRHILAIRRKDGANGKYSLNDPPAIHLREWCEYHGPYSLS